MDLRDLTYFETIAELGHLGRAAEKLNRSQPALSKSIQRLEESLGTQLFLREGRRIKLTAVGELLLARSKPLRQGIEETRRELRDFASGVLGNIRLGCSSTMIEYLLPELAAALLQQAPDITLSVMAGQDDVLLQALRSGQLDVAICPLALADPEWTCHPLLKDEAVVVASKSHPIFAQTYGLADLCRYRWVLPPASVSGRRWLDQVFREHQLPPPSVQIETNSITLSPRLIASTGLLSFLSREALDYGNAAAQLREVPLPETTFKRLVGLVHRSGAYLSPATQKLISVCGELAWLSTRAHVPLAPS
ncbi:LysR family transcriptional regulator [Pseudomonas sp. nanlin1]|uniref:LysR family transcriptional regulator n=1 Tax=Pseudomonas sp. nanlin1 TaxID=3040605 RepID=UPI00389066F9